jgi:hypothetical protein
MRTRLQRHIHSRPSRILPLLPTIRQRRPLSMQSAQLSMKPLADHNPVTHNHSSNQGVRAYTPAPTLSKLQNSPQMTSIRVS